jgi:hypothetical protein
MTVIAPAPTTTEAADDPRPPSAVSQLIARARGTSPRARNAVAFAAYLMGALYVTAALAGCARSRAFDQPA